MPIKSVFFDFMGTCLDWHSSIVPALPQGIDEQQRVQFALSWRQSFFERLSHRHDDEQEPEDIDDTFVSSFLQTADEDRYSQFRSISSTALDKSSTLIRAWYSMSAWPDVAPVLDDLRKKDLELFVLANGSTRLQLDLINSAKLKGKFDMLFSSQLLNVYKPDPLAYQKALALIDRKPEEVLMVACHAYDLRAAGKLGINVAYVRRWTNDPKDEEDQLKEDFSYMYLNNTFDGLPSMIQ